MDTRIFSTAIEFVSRDFREVGHADEGLWIFSLEDSAKHRLTVSWHARWLESYEQPDEHELMIDSGCFRHLCLLWCAPYFPMVSASNVEAVAANDVALQHCGQEVVYVTTSVRRVLIQITFDMMSVRKPLLSTFALKRRGVTIIYNHTYDRIIFRIETANLISYDCHSYFRVTLADAISVCKAMVTT